MGGLIAYRELDDVLGLTSVVNSDHLDIPTGKNTQHDLTALLRQLIYSRLSGYDDTNNAEHICVDPVMRHVTGGRVIDRSTGTVG
jgi:hypothetical protein